MAEITVKAIEDASFPQEGPEGACKQQVYT